MGKLITISRDYGCGALELSKVMAKGLGYEYLDNALIIDLAKKMKTSEGELKSYEDGTSIGLFKFINRYMTDALVKTILGDDFSYVDDKSYKAALEGFFSDLADQGNVVVVGRAAQCILGDRDDVVRIRLVAPMEYRKRFLVAKQKVSLVDAGHILAKKDKERVAYHNALFFSYFNDPTLYHATINLGVVPQDTAIGMIKALL